MKRLVLLYIVVLTFATNGFSQYNCKVLVKNLQGQYNGECKKGLAHGEGSAKGVDSYFGTFRKGFPNGFGVYKYANGDNYIGNFRKGLKDGYGLLNKVTQSGDVVQNYGLWLADSLVVPNDTKALFRVTSSKGIKVIDPKLTKDVSVKNQVWINFQVDGVPDKSVVMQSAEISSGKQIDIKERALNTQVAFDDIDEFPVTVKLAYQIRKMDKFYMVDCETEIVLFTAGLWEIYINH